MYVYGVKIVPNLLKLLGRTISKFKYVDTLNTLILCDIYT